MRLLREDHAGDAAEAGGEHPAGDRPEDADPRAQATTAAGPQAEHLCAEDIATGR